MFIAALLAALCTAIAILHIVYFDGIWSLIMIAVNAIAAIWALSKLFKTTSYWVSLTFRHRSLQDVQRAADEIIAKTKSKAIAYNIYKAKDADIRVLAFEFSSREEAAKAAGNSILKEIYCKWATPEGAKPEQIKEE